jgi:hypothetical protein
VHFDKNNYYVEEKLGSFCVKLLRTGKLTTELPTTVDLSEQLSAGQLPILHISAINMV